MKRGFAVVVVLSGFCLLLTQPAEAQEGIGTYGEYLPLIGDDISGGDIVALDADGYHLSRTSYDEHTFGVVNLNPAVALSIVPGENKVPVVTTGTVSVKVSGEGGAIAVGDFIATSQVPGVGMRANDPGVVLGTALAPFDQTEPDVVEQIPVALNIHFAVAATDSSIPSRFSSQVRQAIVTGAAAATSDPNTALRYAVAAVVMIISLVFGLFVFGRSAMNGVAAIGRNPLARRSIILGISFNVIITVAIVAGGVVAAFFILAL
jgi:hypothetical protein